mmetsp:Transcript_936/g.1505  ORF Transcript_936/g.1505 Transcript_936/m.1505 type:complete len:362 (-) Transcript_936:44-1129(-)
MFVNFLVVGVMQSSGIVYLRNVLRVPSRGIKNLFPVNIGGNKFLSDPATVAVVGSTICSGQPNKGTELGPAALRSTDMFEKLRIVGWDIKDQGDVQYETVEKDEPTKWGMKRSRLCGGANKALAEMMYPLLKDGNFCLNLGGDHSTAAGSLAAVLKARPETRVVWVDAHADINTDRTSPSGNIHGMPIALLMGLIDLDEAPGWEWLKDYPKLKPDRIVYIGLRDVDPGEKQIMYENGIKAYSMHDIDKYNIGPIMERAMNDIDPYGHSPLHLSFDIDSLDPVLVPSTGTPVLGGLTFREGAYICEHMAGTHRLCSMDITEVNPLLGDDNNVSQTVDMAKRMVSCALGETLLWGNQPHLRTF